MIQVSPPLSFLLLASIVVTIAATHSSSAWDKSESDNRARSSPTRRLRGLIVSNQWSHNRRRQPRIIGGGFVEEEGRYPYYALMNGNSRCGAVMISKKFVLTAAHCVGADDDFEIGIEEATFLGSFLSGGKNEYAYKQRVIHPGYDFYSNSMANDIALYELDRDVPGALTPIRLEREALSKPGTPLSVIGFGDTNPDPDRTWLSNSLKQTMVDYVNEQTCKRNFVDTISDDMLCAFREGEDSCGGDSGGPLFLKGETPEEDSLVGLVSWGYECGGDAPGVYARISYFYDWIVDQMCIMNPDAVPSYVECEGNTGGGGSSNNNGIPTNPEIQLPTSSPTSFDIWDLGDFDFGDSGSGTIEPSEFGDEDSFFGDLSDALDSVASWLSNIFGF